VHFDVLPARPAPIDGADTSDPIGTLLSQLGRSEAQK
jgi:hypothetical protein